MAFSVETFGNASIQVCKDGKPVLTTDPWLTGTAYFGSWALDLVLTKDQIDRVVNSQYIWISHGHPDHLHHESLKILPKGTKVLIPDHYHREIFDFLIGEGFDVSIMPYRKWIPLGQDCEALCIDNWNQDAILIIRAGDALLINMNDTPSFGEGPFIRKLVKGHGNAKTYLFALCAIDADMLNLVDAVDRRVIGPPEERKRGAIWSAARNADYLGVANFCCSSSQHLYVRSDSAWANPYRIIWTDMREHWSRPKIRLHEPFVTIDLSSGNVVRNHPSQESDFSRVTDATDSDDWSEKLAEDEWQKVAEFFQRFEILKGRLDVIGVTVGGDTRWFFLDLRKNSEDPRKLRGLRFSVPRASLLETVRWGYFDDLLIGNFMKTEVINTSLYPYFTPVVAKMGGNAKVFTRAEERRFWVRYIRRNPIVFLRHRLEVLGGVTVQKLRDISAAIGMKEPLKRIYRRFLGDPV